MRAGGGIIKSNNNDTDTDNDMNTIGVMINIYRLLLCDAKVPYAISNPPGSTSNW